MSQDHTKNEEKKSMTWEKDFQCNHCGRTEKQEFLVDEEKKFFDQSLRLVECTNCGLVFQDPRPQFQPLVQWIKTRGDINEKLFFRKRNRKNVNRIHKNIILKALGHYQGEKTQLRLFDVGFGAGTVMEEAQKLGIVPSGNEINPYSIEHMREKGFDVYAEPTVQLSITKPFHIITCLDYIEHTYTPSEDLKWMYDHLVEKGIIYLKTLYIGCPNHQKHGDKWILFDPFHYYYYYPDVLLEMMENHFSIIDFWLTKAIIHVIARKDR